ncbi:MAG: MFS transporter [Candidatus Nanopelagicales bacterium]|nr:MFS transporter [Candidatus Nanopelagicales bacterium]MDZ4248819.1 MFS transporter [Candidatus Nanopelagicales bacterium]
MTPRAGLTARGDWFAIGGYAMVAASTQMLWLSFAPVTTQSASFYGVSTDAVGFLSIIFPLVYVVVAIPSGLLLDRWLRPALIAGGLLTAGGGLIRVLDTRSFAFAMLGQVAVSLGQPLVLNAVAKLSISYLPRRQRATGIAVGSAALFVGMLLAFVCGAVWGTDIPLLLGIQAAFAVVAVAVMVVALSRPGRFAAELDSSDIGSIESAAGRPLRTAWADPVIRLLVLLIAVGNGVFVALTTWVQPLLSPAGVAASSADLMLAIMVTAGVVGAVVLPPMAAKRGNQTTWMLLAITVVVLACLALAISPTVWAGFTVSALIGFLLLAMLPIVLDLVEKRAGKAAATATALVWLAGNAGGVAVSALVGTLVESPASAFLLMAVIALAFGMPVVVALRKRLSGASPSSAVP